MSARYQRHIPQHSLLYRLVSAHYLALADRMAREDRPLPEYVCREFDAYRDGTTHVFFEPLDFLARLAAPVPRPRVHLTRFHGVFAPNSTLRAQVTPGGRRKGAVRRAATDERTPAERLAAMTWAQRLKRVFDIDIQTCVACGGAVRIVAAVEEPDAIRAPSSSTFGAGARCRRPITVRRHGRRRQARGSAPKEAHRGERLSRVGDGTVG